MSSSRQRKELHDGLLKLAKSLPRGGTLEFEVHEDYLWLEKIYLPTAARGQGTELLSKVLSLADQAGLPTSLLADPTDEPNDPETYDLARWYHRFGFQLLSVTEDGAAMERAVNSSRPTPLVIQQHARRAKANDLSWEEFHRIAEGGPSQRRPSFLQGF